MGQWVRIRIEEIPLFSAEKGTKQEEESMV